MSKRALLLAVLTLPALACSGLFGGEPESDGDVFVNDDGELDADMNVNASQDDGIITLEVRVEGADSGSYRIFEGSDELTTGTLEEGVTGRWFGEYELDSENDSGSYDYEVTIVFPSGEVTETGTIY